MTPYVRDTEIRITGTVETCIINYPITPSADGGWEYAGTESKVDDEGAEPKRDKDGHALLQGSDGGEYPETLLEWRDD